MTMEDYDKRLDAEAAAIATFGDVEFNSTRPFDDTGADMACSMLHMAHSLAVVLSNHLMQGGEDTSSRNCHLAGVIDAISHFVALANVGHRVAVHQAHREAAK